MEVTHLTYEFLRQTVLTWKTGSLCAWQLKYPLSHQLVFLLRKEVIQPQIPLRLPCYDFILITDSTVGPYEYKTLGGPSFADVTGSVCKTRERIHRGISDPRLLAIPTS